MTQPPQRRDKRLTLELLEAIARVTEGGQPTTTRQLETRRGWTQEQVWRELRLLWEEELIRASSIKVLRDPEGKTNLRIDGLTAEGWVRYNELRRSPFRSWLERNWMWVVTTVIAVVAVVTTL
jgi:hypothetical protein